MDITVKIKTGFFEMTQYHLKAEESKLLLVPIQAADGERLVLRESDILSLTLTDGRIHELQIQTHTSLYSGVLEEGYSPAELMDYLKKRLNINISCEYLESFKAEDSRD